MKTIIYLIVCQVLIDWDSWRSTTVIQLLGGQVQRME